MKNLGKIADLFTILCKKYDNEELGKKVTQKMFYFFERKGIDLNLRYGIHFYGPYSSKLDDIMYYLDVMGIISIDTSGRTHKISLGNTPNEDHGLTESEKETAQSVLNTFFGKTPYELEALATMDYVANSLLKGNYTDEMIVSKFKEIKGDKFDQNIIADSIAELKKDGFLRA